MGIFDSIIFDPLIFDVPTVTIGDIRLTLESNLQPKITSETHQLPQIETIHV